VLVNGGITHQKQQIILSEKGDITQQYTAMRSMYY